MLANILIAIRGEKGGSPVCLSQKMTTRLPLAEDDHPLATGHVKSAYRQDRIGVRPARSIVRGIFPDAMLARQAARAGQYARSS